MQPCDPRELRRLSRALCACVVLFFGEQALCLAPVYARAEHPAEQATAQDPGAAAPAQSPAQNEVPQLRESGPPRRIPRQQALTAAALDGNVREGAAPASSRPVAAAQLGLRNLQTGQVLHTLTSGEGIFRILPI